MPKIFISYARADATELAEELADRLRAMEYDVFLDKHTMVGSIDWEKEIKARARWCDVMLMLVTPAANQSGWVYREFEFARAANRKILPVIVDKTPLPVHLGMYQAIEYTNNLDSVLLQIARIIPPPQNSGSGFSFRRILSFGVITTIIALVLAFLALIPDSQRELWFCWTNNTCPIEIALATTDTPEPAVTDEPDSELVPPSLTTEPIVIDEPTSTPSNTPELTPTVATAPSVTPLLTATTMPTPIYEEDFSHGVVLGWVGLGDGWQIARSDVYGTSTLYRSRTSTGYKRTYYLLSQRWEAVRIDFSVQVSGYLHIYFCKATSTQNYVLNIDQRSSSISFYNFASGDEVNRQSRALLADYVYDVQLEIRGDQVSVTVGGTTLDTFTAPQCNNGREFGFGSEDPALIDNIRVWSLDDGQ
jgi:hypothetical protein